MNFQNQFSNPAMPVGWFLHAAAISRSRSWQGEGPEPDKERDAAARRVIEARADFYDAMTEEFEHLVAVSCRAMGRVPAPGSSFEEITVLMHALSDGLVLRATLHPDRISPELAGRAIYRLAEAFTVPAGPTTDPHRPADDRQAVLFDRAVDAARDLWAAGGTVDFDTIAAAAGTSASTIENLFGSVDAIADSTARLVVPADELVSSATSKYSGQIIVTALEAMAAAADENRELFDRLDLDTGILAEVVSAVADSLRFGVGRGTITCPNPAATARSAVGFAVAGTDRLDALRALLEAIVTVPAPDSGG